MSAQAAQQKPTVRIVIATGKRKTAIARAVIKPGKGRVWINGVPLELWPIEMARWKMMEPLLLAGKDIWSKVDIKVNVRGGGIMAQADAVRMAIARGLVEFTGSQELREIFEEYDRSMIAGDPRQTEPEKPMRRSARRRWQKSYR
ncbi:ribosomal protein S9P [Pyrolobus fumarii 1A]|uniref:Small ribosomal subunit protein uS9 n=1 Tax=Pyrolobus fumarii (strain DSM 11204 / 1A) TaxID=694429 RepID=G0EF25_PYRF1|nr:30S ribosomal protein S9 [Pyrolobus fumarii]AEM38922.1 ribosomal protein S9P [Pyrolobus fumarii 1A]